MARQNVRLVAYAWGRQYVDDLLDFALAAALAPGNLPALAAVFECTAVIVTEEKLFDYGRARHLVLVCEHHDSRCWLARTAFSSTSLVPLMRTWCSSTSMTSMSDRRYAFRNGTE